MPSGPKVALVASRLGYVHRGFETFARSLFDLLRDDLDITLFKGAGPSGSREVVVPSLRADGGLLEALGVPWARRRRFQEPSFAVGMIPSLLGEGYHVVQFSELLLGKTLARLRPWFPLDMKLLFRNGAPSPPGLYADFDFIHQVNEVYADQALQHGVPAERMMTLPAGVDCCRFRVGTAERTRELRRKWNLPCEAQVVLTVAAIRRRPKRIDYLIEEMGRLDPASFFLVVVGQASEDTPGLRQQAIRRIPGRFCFLML
ncbi:MAG TPA: hypothetical protein VN999_13905, partial [Thermoanaerobaculia bacterium]|nr:hypothetical protein [Thermoanaerobaculia bacterium]